MSSVDVVERYLYENVTETSCLGAIFTCSIYDVAVMCYFGLDLTKSKYKNHVLFRYGLSSTTAELHGDIKGRCKVLSRNDYPFCRMCSIYAMHKAS